MVQPWRVENAGQYLHGCECLMMKESIFDDIRGVGGGEQLLSREKI